MKKLLAYTAIGLMVAGLFCVVMLSGCSMRYKAAKCKQWGVCVTVKDSTHIIIKDSTYLVAVPYSIQADSAWMQLLFGCDSLGQVYYSQSETWQGKYIELQKYLKGNALTIQATTKPRIDTVYLPQTNHSESNYTNKVEIQYKDFPPTWWESLRLAAFPYLLVCTLILLVYLVYKIYCKIKKIVPFF
jgi:hypothetical protein